MITRLQTPIGAPTGRLPWYLFPVVALPLYPLLVICVASASSGLFTHSNRPLLPQLHTVIGFPVQFPWCLFTVFGVLCAMLFARLPGAGWVLGLCQCIGGWLLYSALYPPPRHFSSIT